MPAYDVVIVGLGAMGGAAACHAAKRGARVLALDANSPGHKLGSSHGATRATRTAYFEAPDYVPLVQRAHRLWHELGEETGQSLLTMTGALYFGPPGNALTSGVRRAALQHDLPHDVLSAGEAARRFPGFAVPAGWETVWEAGGGLLRAEACLRAHTDLAVRAGAELRYSTRVTGWRRDGDGVAITTADGTCHASAMILAAGPWAPQALAELGLPLTVRRIAVTHFDPIDPAHYPASDFSVYFWMTPEGVFAGFPHLAGEGIKIIRHDRGDGGTPETVSRSVTAAEADENASFLATYMPSANGRLRKTETCLYTMTPDNHFILDRHPDIPGLVYGCGFSGHGFKFAPVIGEALADLALEGATQLPIGFLSAQRFVTSMRLTLVT
jgi:sarcosine oxidase